MKQPKQQQKLNETKFIKLAVALKQNLARRKNTEKRNITNITVCAEDRDQNETN
jgi:hypothetical protein